MTTAHHAPRWIELAGAHNVRDVGGLPAERGRVRAGVLLRGDSLDNVTAEDIAHLTESVGLRGIVDLRAPFETPRAPGWSTSFGITWWHEPLLDLTGLTNPTVMREQAGYDYAKLYGLLLESAGPGLARILGYLVSGSTPALVHCAAGKDRTGVTVALLLTVAGVQREAIVADYLATAERIEIIRAALASRPEYQHLRELVAARPSPQALPMVDPAAIGGVLDFLDATPGGAAGFLLSHGATQDQIDRWIEMIVEPD
jgi:protein-tyrosine phosphatase